MTNNDTITNMFGDTLNESELAFANVLFDTIKRQIEDNQLSSLEENPDVKPSRVVFVNNFPIKFLVNHVEEFQRNGIETNPGKIYSIVANFVWEKFGVLLINIRPGGLASIIDGENRAWALHKLNIKKAPAMVAYGLTVEEEADIFRTQDDNSTQVSPLQKHRAGVIAKNPVDVAIDKAAKARKITIGMGSKREVLVRNINAIQVLKKAYNFTGGIKGVEIVLDTIIDAGWDNSIVGFHHIFLNGVGFEMVRILKEKGEEKDGEIYNTLISILSQYTPDGFAGDCLKEENVHTEMHAKEVAMKNRLRELAGLTNK